jgi:hypothetical protein
LTRNPDQERALEHASVRADIEVIIFDLFLKLALAASDPKLADGVKISLKKIAIDKINQRGQREGTAVQATPEHLLIVSLSRTAKMLAEQLTEILS